MEEVDLDSVPKGCAILCGLGGSSMLGQIITAYLADQAGFTQIGSFWPDDVPPFVLVRDSRIDRPIGLYYSKKYRLVIAQSMVNPAGIEFEIVESIREIARLIGARETVNLDALDIEDGEQLFYLSTTGKNRRMEKHGALPVRNAMLTGITAALLARETCPHSTVFFPSALITENAVMSESARYRIGEMTARMLRFLNSYFRMKADVKKLLRKEKEIEDELRRRLIEEAAKEQKGRPVYMG